MTGILKKLGGMRDGCERLDKWHPRILCRANGAVHSRGVEFRVEDVTFRFISARLTRRHNINSLIT
jgi:hypothetical protein